MKRMQRFVGFWVERKGRRVGRVDGVIIVHLLKILVMSLLYLTRLSIFRSVSGKDKIEKDRGKKEKNKKKIKIGKKKK
jgi:hypothetical protein